MSTEEYSRVWCGVCCSVVLCGVVRYSVYYRVMWCNVVSYIAIEVGVVYWSVV